VNWQTAVALMVVAVAATCLLWGLLRRRKFNFQRDTPCGCSTPSNAASGSSIVFHARKGEQPRIIIKHK